MLELTKEMCNGCGACYNACPQQCIAMVPDELGFLYPEIDTARCIECGACEAACPPLTPLMTYSTPPKVEVGYYYHDRFRHSATSGGIFPMLANVVLERGGKVFGASYRVSDMYLRHRSATEPIDLFALQGMKPSQSDTEKTFTEARELLNQGIWVLYAGTPCQIEGFLAFLGREYETLITVDFLCAGVNSPLLLEHYINGINKDYGGRVVSIRVRDKYTGYRQSSAKILSKPEQKMIMLTEKNPYYQLYLKGYGLRPSCRTCLFKKEHHVADFTIGDVFSGEKHPLEDNEGLSLIMLNTEQAEQIWTYCDTLYEESRKLLYHEPFSLEAERKVNIGLAGDLPVPSDETELFEALKTVRFRKAVPKFLGEENKSFWKKLFGR